MISGYRSEMKARLFISSLLGVLLITLGVAVWIGYAPDPMTPPPVPVAPPIPPSSELHPVEPAPKVSRSAPLSWTPIATPAPAESAPLPLSAASPLSSSEIAVEPTAPAERDTVDARALRERIAERRSARTR